MGLIRFVAALFRPILTLAVTVIVGAFVLAVFWSGFDLWLGERVPVWVQLAPAIDTVRGWLGIEP